jgi:tight adherence protein B
VLSPSALQVSLFVLAAFSVGGILVAALLPRLTGGTKSEKRLETVAGRSKRSVERVIAGEDRGRRRSVEDTLKELEEAQKARAKKNQKPTLTLRMRQAGLGWSKNKYFMVCAFAGVGMAIVSLVVVRLGPLPSIGFGVAGGLLLPHVFVSFTRARRFKKFTAEFPNAVDVIVRGVKAGLPLVDCLKVIAVEAQEPVRSEFQEIIEDQTLGLPLPDAVNKLPERMPLPEANFFAIVIAIQSRTGGSLSEALGNLSKVLRDRKKMAAKITAMSQEAKASAGIIGSLPVIVAVLVYLTSPDYILLLFTTTTGNIVLAISAFWMLVGSLIMRKMINFDY